MSELEIVNKYLMVQYHPKTMNCWEFVKAVYADLGKPLVDIEEFLVGQSASDAPRIAREYKDAMVEVSSPGVFDMVLLDLKGKLHAGIVLSKGRFIHLTKAGASVMRLGNLRWWSHIIGYYRQVN